MLKGLTILSFLLVINFYSLVGEIKAVDPIPPSVDGTAVILIEPDPVPIGDPFTIKAAGKGLGTYTLLITQINASGIEVTTPGTVNFTVDQNDCKIGPFTNIFSTAGPRPSCSFIDRSAQIWKFEAHRKLQEGSYTAKINKPFSNDGFKSFAYFTVGNPALGPLTVSVEPSGPLNNDIDNQVIVKWSPVQPGETYNVSVTGIATQGNRDCSNPPQCSQEYTIPAATPGGDIQFTVVQDGNIANRGTATIKMNAVIAPNISSVVSTPACKDRNSPGWKLGDIPCASAAGQSCTTTGSKNGIATAIGCIPTNPVDFIQGLLRWTASVGGGVSLLLMIYGAFQMITSAGNPDNLKKAHDQFANAIIGLLFILFSVLLLQVIGVNILNIPNFKP